MKMGKGALVAVRVGGWRVLFRPARRAGGILALAAVVGGVLATASSCAAAPLLSATLSPDTLSGEPPVIHGELDTERVFATRAMVVAEVNTFDLGAHWRAELTTGPVSGPWVLAGEGTTGGGNSDDFISIGSADATTPGSTGVRWNVQHHLVPGTNYFARFTLEDAAGTVTRTFEFKTLAIGKPEVPELRNEPGGHTTFEAEELAVAKTKGGKAFKAQIETNGLTTEYNFEYALARSGPWKPFSSGANGTITKEEDFADPEPELIGLAPETTYFVRLTAKNADGELTQNRFVGVNQANPEGEREEVESFTTPTERPIVQGRAYRNITATSARVVDAVDPREAETRWQFESSTHPQEPSSWAPIPGLEGTITEAQSQAGGEAVPIVEGTFDGLHPASEYCIRVAATNKVGATQGPESCFETEGPPTAVTEAVHARDATSLRVLGAIDPHATPTTDEQAVTVEGTPSGGTFTLSFEGHTTGPIAFDAPAQGGSGSIARALESLPGEPELSVVGLRGGPYTVSFVGAATGQPEPAITADGSELQPAGKVTVSTIQAGGEGYDTAGYFEYVTRQQFEESGFQGATKTAAQPLKAVVSEQFFGQDLPGLEAGLTYEFRAVASSTFPGAPVVDAEPQTMTVPAAAAASTSSPCPNSALRTGPSANLPDCRAYEQVTPVDKEGAQEPFNYGPAVVSGAIVGGDGEHVALEDPSVSWGSEPGSGQSPYFFSRDSSRQEWTMTAGSPQPETGVQRVVPELYSENGSEVASEVDIHTSLGSGESKEILFKAGPGGGPYQTVAAVPRDKVEGIAEGNVVRNAGWVGASADFSKLILQVEDPELAEARTQTKSGKLDVYEYDEGQLRQINVGAGTCGAHLVAGSGEASGYRSSAHAVSADGSRVFFEAVPGSICSATPHLYIRENGSKNCRHRCFPVWRG